MMRGVMTGLEKKHKLLMGVYFFGAAPAMAAAWLPSFLCRAGGVVLLIGLMHMIVQRRSALRQGLEAQRKLRQSILYYVPFLAGANLIWMGLPLPVELMAKATLDCIFLAGTVALLALVYVYNVRTVNSGSH